MANTTELRSRYLWYWSARLPSRAGSGTCRRSGQRQRPQVTNNGLGHEHAIPSKLSNRLDSSPPVFIYLTVAVLRFLLLRDTHPKLSHPIPTCNCSFAASSHQHHLAFQGSRTCQRQQPSFVATVSAPLGIYPSSSIPKSILPQPPLKIPSSLLASTVPISDSPTWHSQIRHDIIQNGCNDSILSWHGSCWQDGRPWCFKF